MKIELTSEITVKLIQHVGNDNMIVAAAKVSTDGEEAVKQLDLEPKFGLINYLMKQLHSSPFEHGSMTFFVNAPIFVWREHQRHRFMSFNEESGRYKKLEPKFWIPIYERKMVPVEGYKASRPEFKAATDLKAEEMRLSLQLVYQEAYKMYSQLVESGFAKEVCRACLPVGIYSSCWVTCNPRSLMQFLSLRTHDKDAKFVSYPQAEIEEVARQYEDIFKGIWPLTYKAYVENGRVAP